jgi:hypothetical protein
MTSMILGQGNGRSRENSEDLFVLSERNRLLTSQLMHDSFNEPFRKTFKERRSICRW